MSSMEDCRESISTLIRRCLKCCLSCTWSSRSSFLCWLRRGNTMKWKRIPNSRLIRIILCWRNLLRCARFFTSVVSSICAILYWFRQGTEEHFRRKGERRHRISGVWFSKRSWLIIIVGLRIWRRRTRRRTICWRYLSRGISCRCFWRRNKTGSLGLKRNSMIYQLCYARISCRVGRRILNSERKCCRKKPRNCNTLFLKGFVMSSCCENKSIKEIASKDWAPMLNFSFELIFKIFFLFLLYLNCIQTPALRA